MRDVSVREYLPHMLQRIARVLIRLTGYPQEYLCLEAGAMAGGFTWHIAGDPIDPREILFLGYGPLVLGLPPGRAGDVLELHQAASPVASMRLRALDDLRWPGMAWKRGDAPRQRFLPAVWEPLDRLRQWINSRQRGNVTRAMKDYDLLRIAYAQPREIHLAVVGPPERCNIFPTDLHGPVGPEHYIISLRHANKACAQVQAAGRLVLCRMHLDRYRVVYGLARRHGASMEPAGTITQVNGDLFGHALPKGTLDALHLQLEDHVDAGIHRLLRFRIMDAQHVGGGAVLAHAHAAPLGLLKRSGRPVQVLLR